MYVCMYVCVYIPSWDDLEWLMMFSGKTSELSMIKNWDITIHH